MWEKFTRVFQFFKNMLCEIAGWLCFGMVLMIFIDVIGRYFFNAPLPSVYEISEDLLMVTFIFLAVPSAFHINVTLLASRYPPRMKTAAKFAKHLLSMLFLALVAWKSLQMAWTSYAQAELSESYLAFPLYPGRVAVAIGFMTFTINEFIELVQLLQRSRK